MSNVIVSEQLIEIGLDKKTKEEVIQVLADKLKALDYVKDGYLESILRRENDFPTGLNTIIPIALCHTEQDFVKQSALAVGTLKNPVEFQEMGAPDRIVKAEIVFLLALNDPKDQVPWLRKMITVFKSKEVMEEIKFSDSNKALTKLLEKLFVEN
jgi:PTS system galactitol-specific IIA component